MPTQRWEKLCTDRRSSVAKTCSSVPGSCHASVMAVLVSWQQASSRIVQTECTHLPELLVHRANQWASMDVCDRKRGGCGRHHELCPFSCIDRSQRSKSQDERKEERSYYNQSKSRTDSRGCSHQGERRRFMSKMRPRTSCFQHNFGTNSALSWMDSRRSTVYADQGMPKWSHNPWRAAEYQPYRRWNSASGSGGSGILPRRDDGVPNPPPLYDWTAQVQALAANPAWGTGTVCSVATSPSTVSAPSISTTARGDVDDGSLGKCFPKKTDPLGTGGVWTRERIGLVCNRPVHIELEPESVNLQQDKSSDDKFNCKKKDEPLLTHHLK